eukprot:TRINITY_DN5951_c0_g1_i2.p1 TRINITY_DN5951_c0_g1~~TRINITY_DN5951_c0_g1_i2.p1  ORF type:complete len:232 (-),score=64.05 TRINITY_DN5951_c0_g1_i2:63-758(-)
MSTALIYGGAGQLGSVVVRSFKSAGWKVLSADVRPQASADLSIVFKNSPADDAKEVLSKVASVGDGKLDAVVVVAGGFAMGSIGDDGIFASLERMFNFNVVSSVSAAHVASKTLRDAGLLVLTGAEGALRPTPYFVGYGVSKAGTHHLLSTLASPQGGLPKDATAVAILPVMLDTPQNRADMPDADFSSWTPLEDVAQTLVSWASGKDRPKSGSKVVIKTENQKTSFVAHD